MSAADDLESVRVLTKREAQKVTGLSEDTWFRMERIGDTPPITRLSDRRVGYRVIDLRNWLDSRRERMTA
jgi:predicted DNA-binding transcriptional regulator AlpA